MKDTYIYERNPDTGEVFRRKKLDYSKRELIYKPKHKEKQENDIVYGFKQPHSQYERY